EARIPDPEATKPEDWDEDAPFEVIDEEAEKPADWLDDEPSMVPDPEAEKPEDWDDEEDGDWIAPQVPNPKCDEVAGCGKWEKPTKRNPDYKGKWTAPFVENPLYKGVWAPRKIANPKYFEDKTPANFEPVGAIGFEIWTMQKDILFDNIYIGHSIADAEKLKAETFDVKHPVEKAEEEKNKPKIDDKKDSPLDLNFMDDPVAYVKEKFELFVELAKHDPVVAAKTVPEIAGGAVAVVLLVIGILAGGIFGGAKAAPSKEQVKSAADKAKASATEIKDKAAEAIATGTEKAQSEVNKRTTRSQAS
ncbi:MAG: hypothetical protein INR71_11255, partial [Terriglobus roseus]|nr:hypothetical protein [Terriglobus roseus]